MVQRVGGDSARAVSWSWQLTSPTPDSTFGASERDQLMGGRCLMAAACVVGMFTSLARQTPEKG